MVDNETIKQEGDWSCIAIHYPLGSVYVSEEHVQADHDQKLVTKSIRKFYCQLLNDIIVNNTIAIIVHTDVAIHS